MSEKESGLYCTPLWKRNQQRSSLLYRRHISMYYRAQTYLMNHSWNEKRLHRTPGGTPYMIEQCTVLSSVVSAFLNSNLGLCLRVSGSRGLISEPIWEAAQLYLRSSGYGFCQGENWFFSTCSYIDACPSLENTVKPRLTCARMGLQMSPPDGPHMYGLVIAY